MSKIVTASSKHNNDGEIPTAVPITISSTSKTWENGNRVGHYEQHGNGEKATGRSNIHYPGGQRAQYHQELGNRDLVDEQEDQGHGKTVSQYEKGYQYGVGKAALDKHVENALLKSELYGDPGKLSVVGEIFLGVILILCQLSQSLLNSSSH
jgi:hypothetical protein